MFKVVCCRIVVWGEGLKLSRTCQICSRQHWKHKVKNIKLYWIKLKIMKQKKNCWLLFLSLLQWFQKVVCGRGIKICFQLYPIIILSFKLIFHMFAQIIKKLPAADLLQFCCTWERVNLEYKLSIELKYM